MMVWSKPTHVGAFVTYSNVNFNVLKQIYCALVELIKDWVLLTVDNMTPKVELPT
jgi:hypothetical protein